jgi:glycosyltransferase involved in cell wall biosynthesis
MFSVVIPVYNHERYLVECVLSAVRSPLVTEVLLLDDGSSDGSAVVARQLAGGALGKVRDVTPAGRGNQGAHATLNELVRQASNEWVAVLNSDDTFTPSRFELIHRRMRFKRFDLLFGNVLLIDAQGRQLGGKRAMYDPQLPFPANFDVAQMAARAEWLPLLAHQNFLATTSNMVFRKDLFQQIGGFADLRYVHDWDFCLRASLAGTVDYLPHALTNYRVHSGNTIKEDSAKVDREVRVLFEKLLLDHPSLLTDEAFEEGLAANPYLKQRDRPFLSVVLPATEGHEVYAQGLRRCLTGVEITTGSPEGEYVYAPDSTLLALHPVHLQNAVLALEMQDLDLLLVSHTLAEVPQVGTHGLKNAGVLRQAARGTQTMKAQVARLLPGGGTVTDLAHLIPGVTITAGKARAEPLPTSLRSQSTSTKRVIFVLPALFAVGGVERLVIDMMRQLGDRYEFVVITVERLTESQGSLYGSAEGIALAFFDLAELAPPELFLPMMERLRSVYNPALVWVPNGSPWQCDHAAQIRQVFHSIPIVDQQVYDTEAGWIARYHEPGIRSYDRFIAINRRIEETFIRKYGIPADKIDMIYHSVNLGALGPAERTDTDRREYRAKYGLPEGKQIFGWVGRCTPQKRPLEFLQFAKQAGEKDDQRHFLMIGDGELGAECDRYIAEQSVGNVTRIRFSNRMGELFALMNGMLGASAYEGLPISMLEALAMGVPVFSTDVGDVGLVLSEYNAGAVTPAAWDQTRYLADFELWLSNLPGYADNARKAAHSVRERFGSVAVAAEYESSFQKAWKQCGECYT